jgi:hypothetical protein
MKNDTELRNHLFTLLKGGNAHMTLFDAVESFPEKYMNTLFPNGSYTPWDLLEHMRHTQWDILDFMTNPNYKEMHWPDDYWPPAGKKATAADWQKTITQFRKDSEELQKMVKDKKVDLFAKIPHGDGQTVLREILLVTDHNAYHIGEFAIMRQVMKTWGKDHE